MLGLEEGNLISQFLDLELMLLIRLIRILLQMLKGWWLVNGRLFNWLFRFCRL